MLPSGLFLVYTLFENKFDLNLVPEFLAFRPFVLRNPSNIIA